MKKSLLKNCFLVFLFSCFLVFPVFAYTNPGQPTGYANDFAGVLAADQKQALENKLVQFEKDTSNEISIVTIASLDGDTIENFAVELFKDWGIGKKNKDNGVLLLVAINDRQMRIEVGYGLEGALTDAQSYWIINDIMKPAFRENNYYGGIDGAVDKIIAATKGEYVPEEKLASGLSNSNWEFIFWVVIFVILWLASILGRSKSWWAGGVIGGIIGVIIGVIKGFLYFGIASIVILIPLGLLFDFVVSRSYAKHKAGGPIPWWIGGGRGGSGFGGGGFGGFGGGGSGGGGSSGSW
ncbi:MAG: TPM domain-containing protein [Patescibacteria group bacterium]|nr:TPM domain-containing protein [Patescibacteria group bacterium]MDD4611169.1 TPM domain-containing protein [Patescibacteria group bacterium]